MAERSEKRVRSAEHRRRAVMCLAQLAWLEGYPLGERWQLLDGTSITVDGDLLSRSRRIAQTTLREHHGGLRALVGDVDRWWTLVDTTLAWCAKRATPLDLLDHAPPRIARAARELAARTPKLRSAIIAAGIAWAQHPDTLARVLDWLRAREAVLAALPLADVLLHARLALDHERGIDALLALGAIDAPDPQQALAALNTLGQRIAGKQAESAVPVRSTQVVAGWRERLIAAAPARRTRALALLAHVDIAAAIGPWAEWERANADRVARVRSFAARGIHHRGIHRDAERDNLAGVKQALEAAKRTPDVVDLAHLLRDVDALADTPFHAAVTRLLAALPAAWSAPVRARMMCHFADCVEWADKRVGWLWESLAAMLERGAPPALLAPWHDAMERGRHTHADSDWVGALVRRADIERVVRVLVGIVERGKFATRDAGACAAAWVAAGVPDAVAIDTVLAMYGDDDTPSREIARAARALADGTPADLVAQAKLLQAAFADLSWGEREQLLASLERWAREGHAWLVRRALAAGLSRALGDATGMAALVPESRRPALQPFASSAPWFRRYPAALHDALGKLAAVDPDAERRAAHVLATDYPDTAGLVRELGVLRTKPATPATTRRIANLEVRLAAPRLPSPARLARLADKLEHAAATIALARYTDAATALATERIARTFGLGAWPWPLDRPLRTIVLGLLQLGQADRQLVALLLRTRSGPPPWDLREEPRNRAFLERLRARGIDPQPWLDTSPHIVEAGGPLELALCGDPLDVFAMGAHFETCLSPDGVNFFSVVANAADINKRVLYARREGRVVGRCLLALSDEGAMLAFNPYRHESFDFTAIVRDFATALAARMGTTLVAYAKVSTLLARDWYDDGARDLVGRFAGLASLRDRLAELEAAQFVAALREALQHDVDDVTLPFVLGLPLDEHPRLFAPLVPYVLASRIGVTRVRAAQVAFTFDAALADRLLGEHAGAVDLDDHAWPGGVMFAQLRPSDTLARLRALRRSERIRRWSDERGDRVAVAGVALAMLQRPRQAATLLQLALELDAYPRDQIQAWLDWVRP